MAPASFPRRLLGKVPAATFGPAFSTLGSNAAIQTAALVGSILVARELGGAVRGEYAGATAWCALLSAFSDFGVSQAVAYRTARVPLAPGATIGTGLAFAAIAGTLGALVGLLATFLILVPRNPALALATGVYLPSIPILLIATYASLSAQGLGLLRTFNAIRLSMSFTTLGGVALSLMLGMRSGAGVMGAIVSLQALAMLVALLLLHKKTSAGSWRIDRDEMRHLWGFGLQAHLGNLAWLANGKLDQMVMSIALTTRELGHYSIAVSYAGLVFSLANATTNAGFSSLAAEISPGERFRRIGLALRRIGKLGLVLGAVLAILAPWAIPFAFGAEFRAAVIPALILIAGGTILGLNYTLSVGLRASGRPILTSVGEGVGLLVTAVGLSFVLARFGIVGAASLSVVSYVATFVMLALLLRRSIGKSLAHNDPTEVARG